MGRKVVVVSQILRNFKTYSKPEREISCRRVQLLSLSLLQLSVWPRKPALQSPQTFISSNRVALQKSLILYFASDAGFGETPQIPFIYLLLV